MINLDVTREDFHYIQRIAARAFSAGIYSTAAGDTMQDSIMDLQAVHANGCPLDLPELAQSKDLHFAHDLNGIRRYLDRDTGRLLDHWTPRYVKVGTSVHRLIILACSATKRDDPGFMPAIKRYDGPLWQTFRLHNPTVAPVACAFLSSRYGFGDALRPIEYYNERMSPEKARSLIEGGTLTRWPRPPSPKKPDSYGLHAACVINGLSQSRARPFSEVALVGGELYLSVMRSYVEQFRADGHLTPDAVITEINAPIGYMRQQLRAWLQAKG